MFITQVIAITWVINITWVMIYNLGNIQRPEINQIVPIHEHGCISNNSLFLVPFRSPGNKLWDQKKIVLILLN